MLFDVHTAMQDADNFDQAFFVAVKNHVLADTVLKIPLSNVIACAAQTGFVRQIVKRSVKLCQVTYLLSLPPLPARIAANGKQVIPGFLREDERSHLFIAFQFIQEVLQGIIGRATLLAFG